MDHFESIDFPNGKGFTPCTFEYLETKQARDDIKAKYYGAPMDEWSPEDYQEWSVLDDKLGNLQINGHVGKSILY